MVLTIELDRADRTYAPGEAITGRVRARPSQDLRCDALTVSVEVHTHGKGNPASAVGASEVIFRGDWSPGESVHEFALRAPSQVRLYHGELINVGFRVVATADVPWAFDPRVEEEIAVVHPPPQSLRLSWDEPAFAARQASAGPFTCGGIVAMLLGVGLMAGAGTSSFLDEIAPCSLPLLILGGIVAIGSGRRWLAQRKLGAVRLRLVHEGPASYRAQSGGLTCRLELRPGANVRAARAEIVVRETATRGSGTDKKTETHELHGSDVDLALAEPGVYVGRLELPPIATTPYSFKVGDSGIEWLVNVRVEIDGWPDWSSTIPLVAAP